MARRTSQSTEWSGFRITLARLRVTLRDAFSRSNRRLPNCKPFHARGVDWCLSSCSPQSGVPPKTRCHELSDSSPVACHLMKIYGDTASAPLHYPMSRAKSIKERRNKLIKGSGLADVEVCGHEIVPPTPDILDALERDYP